MWDKETACEKQEAQTVIDNLNRVREKRCKEEWELETVMKRAHIREGRTPGPTP